MISSKYLNKKVALITGASSGIGESIARKLSREGIRVILVARREDRLAKLSNEINLSGGDSVFYPVDLSNEIDRIKLWKYLTQKNLLPDILVNNAGIGWYGYFYDMPWSIAQDLLSLNIQAMVHLTRLALPIMLTRHYGHIINIGSISGKLPEQGIALYSSSKNFMDSFTTVLYREIVGTNVHISVIRAGPIKTEFFDSARKLDNGGSIPAEKMATSPSSVSNKVWNLIQKPRKIAYVPFWTALSPLLEVLFHWLIDLIGPILLSKKKQNST
jgi:short-subunit dehydrogenase